MIFATKQLLLKWLYMILLTRQKCYILEISNLWTAYLTYILNSCWYSSHHFWDTEIFWKLDINQLIHVSCGPILSNNDVITPFVTSRPIPTLHLLTTRSVAVLLIHLLKWVALKRNLWVDLYVIQLYLNDVSVPEENPIVICLHTVDLHWLILNSPLTGYR